MRTVAVFLMLAAGLAAAPPSIAQPATDRFAYGLPLAVSGELPFYELELPLAVYRGSKRNDLGDLRVFNAAGQVVPHALRSPVAQTRQQEAATADLPFFPIPDASGPHADQLVLHVERTPAGSIIDLRTGKQDGRSPAGPPCGYLLDASRLSARLDALELLWSADTAAFLAEVTVESSNDLVSWKTLTTAAVGWLSYQGDRLNRNRIDLSQANGRYLRLHWPAGTTPAQLSRVRGFTRQSYLVERPAPRHLVLTPERISAQRYRIDLQGTLPVTGVTVQLQDGNAVAAVRLLSAATADGPLQERWRGLAYNLTVNGSTMVTPAIPFPLSRQRIWELFLNDSEAMPGMAPQLEFAWQPDRLVFLAQGRGPFMVAYGNAAIGPADFPLESLLETSVPARGGALQPQLVQPGEPIVLGGDALAASRLPLPWKEYSLWGILSFGVLLVGGMSFSLYRKLRDSNPV